MIRLTIPDIDEEDIAAVNAVLRSGFLVQGKYVAAFEDAVASYVGIRHAVAVSNCTAALHLSLIALGIGEGDAVAVSAYSWPATANVVELVGAVPKFVDIDKETYNLDPQALEQVLLENDVKAVLAVHAFGNPADMRRILALTQAMNVPVVEDAACALGSRLHNRFAGTWGAIGCFSFHPRKAITTGEGGMIVTDDSKVADACRALRNHGQDPNAAQSDFLFPGFNMRMTDFQGALGVSQMKKIEQHVTERRIRAAHYGDLLRGTNVQVPAIHDDPRHNYQSYVILLPSRAAERRDRIIVGLRKRGIETTIGTYNIASTSFYSKKYGADRASYPITDEIAARALTLPLHEQLSTSGQDYVVRCLLRLLHESADLPPEERVSEPLNP